MNHEEIMTYFWMPRVVVDWHISERSHPRTVGHGRDPTVCSNELVGIRIDREHPDGVQAGISADSFHFYHEHRAPWDEGRWLKYGDHSYSPVRRYKEIPPGRYRPV